MNPCRRLMHPFPAGMHPRKPVTDGAKEARIRSGETIIHVCNQSIPYGHPATPENRCQIPENHPPEDENEAPEGGFYPSAASEYPQHQWDDKDRPENALEVVKKRQFILFPAVKGQV